ncbi:methyltransferase domain-containing protein [Microlunatus elymi]|uniref:Trans-aconitate 2-methyltransferase n=1 Tax=Microlunatus elymi TaxID=2596828 RepID=A0A516PYX4_9ACTN|nr:methyltransferase domain-containing protein [Microlunatus elymi]QDP96370.1 methyltransferase domain-containing protein [Microlunatus elymi]
MPTWDPMHYLKYADERSRPFHELLARVGAEHPRSVVDLGCGPGQLTATLAQRWPDAQVLGLDSSPEMIAAASAYAGDRLRFEVQDLQEFVRDGQQPAPDVIVSNATLQWVDDHRAVLPGLVDVLAPGGWLAFQVPGNQNEPSHTLLHELGSDPRFAAATGGIDRRVMPPAAAYLDDLTGLGCTVDAWETTYLHLLTGEDAVFEWISGTGARPYLQALSEVQRPVFVAEYQQRLRQAYPSRPYGTVLPFRRIFAVARKNGRP